MKTIKKSFLIFVPFFLSLFSYGDVLEMKDGQIFDGLYMGGTRNTIRFQSENEMHVFPVSEVLAITFTKNNATTAGKVSTPARVEATTPPTAMATLPAGTKLFVRMSDGITSKDAAGKRFTTTLETDLVVNGLLVAPTGTKVYGFVEAAKNAGNLAGRSILHLSLTDITIGDRLQPILTSEYIEKGRGSTGDSLVKIGLGAAIGGLIDGKDGAKKGAAVGTGVAAITRGEKLDVPPGTLLQFRLIEPLQATLSPYYRE